jgi:hypothetical protein
MVSGDIFLCEYYFKLNKDYLRRIQPRFSITKLSKESRKGSKKKGKWMVHVPGAEKQKEVPSMGPYINIGPSISVVAEMYGVTERTVRNWISKGLIKAYKRNNHAVFIDERSLDNILTPIKGVAR